MQLECELRQQFYSREKWYDLNEECIAELNLDSKDIQAFIFTDAHVALLEALWGFSRQHITKRKLFVVKGVSPYFEQVIQLLVGMGVEIYELDIEKALFNDEWLDKLDHSTLAFLFARDIAFTAEQINWHSLQEKLVQKKVLQVEVIHSSHFVNGVSDCLNPLHVQIYDFLGSSSLCLMGRRASYESVVAKGMNWDSFDIHKVLSELKTRKEDKSLVKDFEKSLPKEVWTLAGLDSRIFDRAIFSFKNMSAQALIEYLSEKNVEYKSLQTPSLTCWGSLKAMDWLLPHLSDIEIIRGLIVVPLELLAKLPVAKDVTEAYSEIIKLQEG